MSMGIDNPVHLLFIGAVALIVLGPKRLPELAKALGHGIREFREAMDAGAHEQHTTVHQQLAPPPAVVVQPSAAASSATPAPNSATPAASSATPASSSVTPAAVQTPPSSAGASTTTELQAQPPDS